MIQIHPERDPPHTVQFGGVHRGNFHHHLSDDRNCPQYAAAATEIVIIEI